MDDTRINLLAKVARSMAGEEPDLSDKKVSILSIAAASYGARPDDDATVPTGFDPLAVTLFETIVEGAYLVATADGVFDEDERRAFERVVVAACGGVVAPGQISSLVNDLADQLAEDGTDRRLQEIGKQVTRKEHAREVLRIAALLAQASQDVSDVERQVLEKLARVTGLDASEVDAALADVREAMKGKA